MVLGRYLRLGPIPAEDDSGWMIQRWRGRLEEEEGGGGGGGGKEGEGG